MNNPRYIRVKLTSSNDTVTSVGIEEIEQTVDIGEKHQLPYWQKVRDIGIDELRELKIFDGDSIDALAEKLVKPS